MCTRGPVSRIGSMRPLRRSARSSVATVTGRAGRNLMIALVALLLAVPVQVAAQEESPANTMPTRPSVARDMPRQDPRGFLFIPPVVRVGLRMGFNFARARSSLFDFVTDELTLNRSDFGGFAIGGDFAVRVSDPVDIVFSGTFITSSAQSSFEEWEDQDGLPITQRTTFDQTPLTASLRLYVTPRGRQIGRFAWVPARFSPYIGGGGGMVHYSFQQTGSFVDFADLSIFDATLEASGWAPVALVNAGFDVTLTPRATLNTDLRYHLASADIKSTDFQDFTDGIDLNGLQMAVGVHFRF